MSAGAGIRRDGDVAVFRFDNPPVNALAQPVRAALAEAVEALDADAAVRAIVLIGAGRNFVAGADLREFDAPPREPFLPAVLSRLEACGKHKADEALDALERLLGTTARVIVDGREEHQPLENISIGQRLHVRPGEIMPDARRFGGWACASAPTTSSCRRWSSRRRPG